MSKILTIVQIVISVLLIASVLLQQQGVGLSSSFGGEGNIFRTKRGVEKILFYATIALAVAFMGAGVATILIA
jgi:preprotein translocase subunit SecG